jgi:hypothetical protein
MNPRGFALIIIGALVITQVTAGHALQRMGLL